MAGHTRKQAIINGVTYNVAAWSTEQQGGLREEEWTDFSGGLGEFERKSPNRYYLGENIDTTMGTLRLRPYEAATIAVSNLGGGPVYGFTTKSANYDMLYICSGSYTHKIRMDNNTLLETISQGGTCGPPALFEGKWYLPLGDSQNAVRLNAITDTTGDTWQELDATAGQVPALAFAVGMDGPTAYLIRAYNTNLVQKTSSISATPEKDTDWTGDSFEVGSSSNAITDMLPWLGEIAVIKPDSPYRFGITGGESYPIQEYVGIDDSPEKGNIGAMSTVHGAYLYWMHTTGIYRCDRASIRAVDPINDPRHNHQRRPAGDIWADTEEWYCAQAIGRWLYVSREDRVLAGYVKDGGEVVWHGSVFQGSTGGMGLVVSRPETGSNAPILWLCDTGGDEVVRIDLNTDGSLRTQGFGSVFNRGEDSLTATIHLPNVDFGDPFAVKQLRSMSVRYHDWTSQATITLSCLRNREITEEDNATTYSSTSAHGNFEVAFTPGTDDECTEAMMVIQIVTTGIYNEVTEDPYISAAKITAAVPTIYRCVIPMTTEDKVSGQATATEMQKLRDLLGGKWVDITEPNLGGPTDEFSGRIVGLREDAVSADDARGGGYAMIVLIERWNYGNA